MLQKVLATNNLILRFSINKDIEKTEMKLHINTGTELMLRCGLVNTEYSL